MVDKEAMLKEFEAENAAKAEAAADDLRRVEQEVVAEATMSTEFEDALGDEQAAAEAAETAFEFEAAQPNVK